MRRKMERRTWVKEREGGGGRMRLNVAVKCELVKIWLTFCLSNFGVLSSRVFAALVHNDIRWVDVKVPRTFGIRRLPSSTATP